MSAYAIRFGYIPLDWSGDRMGRDQINADDDADE